MEIQINILLNIRAADRTCWSIGSAKDLAGKSGRLEIKLLVECNTDAEKAYGVAAVVQTEENQSRNITVNGGTLTKSEEKNTAVYRSSVLLDSTANIYEMQISMDVTDFDPAKYIVVINPMDTAAGGSDRSLEVLLAAAGEIKTSSLVTLRRQKDPMTKNERYFYHYGEK